MTIARNEEELEQLKRSVREQEQNVSQLAADGAGIDSESGGSIKLTIIFTKPMLDRLKKLHAQAAKAGEESFMFDGHEFYTGYAGYLIQYLETKLK